MVCVNEIPVPLDQIRTEVNKVLETARGGKLIGASLDAKVFLSTANKALLERLSLSTNNVEDPDRLYRVFLTSEVMSLLCEIFVLHVFLEDRQVMFL
jgi:hypothetical protein